MDRCIFSLEQVNEIIRLYTIDNMSMTNISKKFNVTESTIRTRLIRNNIKIRSKSEFSRKFPLNQSFFEKIDSERKAYWLGFLYADGAVYKHKHGSYFHLTLNNLDKHMVEQFKKDLETTINLRTNKNNQTGLMINSNKMVQDLINLGCMPCKTFKIKFPTIKQVPTHLIHHFIRGYFDGDGSVCFSEKKNRIEVKIISNEDFCYALQNTIGQLCNISKFYKYKVCETKYSKQFYTNIGFGSSSSICNFYNFIYKDASIYLKRKRDIFDKFFNYKNYINNRVHPNRKYTKVVLIDKNNGNTVTLNNVKEECMLFNLRNASIYQLIKGKIKEYKNYIIKELELIK